jgi:hypothetical protein
MPAKRQFLTFDYRLEADVGLNPPVYDDGAKVVLAVMVRCVARTARERDAAPF